MSYVLKDHDTGNPDDYSWDRNPYSSPSRYGLTVVASASEPWLSYEFNLFVVWEDNEGKFYAEADAGCSCPVPFEAHDELEEVTSLRDLQSRLEEWVSPHDPENERFVREWNAEAQEVLKAAQKAGLRLWPV